VDFPNADKQNTTKQLFRIDHAFVVVDGKVVKPDNSNRCEEPAPYCGWYWLPASAAISVALRQGKLAIGFNREPNGLDINLPLDPTDGIRTKPDEYQAFAKCIVSIADRAEAKIQHQRH
jgi:hypothetical protein